MPACCGPGTFESDLPRVAQLVQDETNGRRTDARQGALDITFAKVGGRLSQDVVASPVLLAAATTLPRRCDPVLEVRVSIREYPSDVGRPRPDAVLAHMPALLRLVQARVVGVLRF